MQRRLGWAAAAAGLLLAITPAEAAPRCPFLVDPAGDQRSPEGDVKELSSESLDIRAANITTTRSAVVATIQVTDLDLERATNAGGLGFHAYLDTGQVTFDLLARHYPDGDVGHLMRIGARVGAGSTGAAGGEVIGEVDVWFDEDRSLITLTAELRDFGRGLQRGTKVPRVLVASDFSYGTSGKALHDAIGYRGVYGGNANNVDSAYTDRGYVVGDRGCAF